MDLRTASMLTAPQNIQQALLVYTEQPKSSKYAHYEELTVNTKLL